MTRFTQLSTLDRYEEGWQRLVVLVIVALLMTII